MKKQITFAITEKDLFLILLNKLRAIRTKQNQTRNKLDTFLIPIVSFSIHVLIIPIATVITMMVLNPLVFKMGWQEIYMSFFVLDVTKNVLLITLISFCLIWFNIKFKLTYKLSNWLRQNFLNQRIRMFYFMMLNKMFKPKLGCYELTYDTHLMTLVRLMPENCYTFKVSDIRIWSEDKRIIAFIMNKQQFIINKRGVADETIMAFRAVLISSGASKKQ